MPKIMLFAHDTEYVYFWNDSAIPGPNPIQNFVIIHSSLELSTQKIEKKKKRKKETTLWSTDRIRISKQTRLISWAQDEELDILQTSVHNFQAKNKGI